MVAMSNNLRPAPSLNVVPAAAGSIVNRFAQVSEVAKPTLDAALKLRDSTTWIADRKRRDPNHNRLLLNEKLVSEFEEAEARIALIPDIAFLQQAEHLFEDAVRKSAPEAWFHLALGAMLSAMPNARNVAPEYQFSVVDSIVHDDENWERDCQPGFSPPVFVCAIRQVRRETEFVPSVAEILKACQQQRNRFRELGSNATLLAAVRENAETVVSEWQVPF